ncbi:hypothetical protein GTNG_3400 [Geobacillus thermodenitrificans NG80-2]|uniref:Uncharacterized protein n=1 Tax=Geobacillus thermodenitrificans (strain NG80-2) TaxID=420246 RepID=A4ITT3_GEOTN|nr:hypothetical protein GTNG_3400 [Geobacillus thermodenitrificans NG80-2]
MPCKSISQKGSEKRSDREKMIERCAMRATDQFHSRLFQAVVLACFALFHHLEEEKR